MKITRVGPKDWFTGNVRVDSLFLADGGRQSDGGAVTFEPGARTRWHTHPAGQTIIITQGLGWVQRDGGPIEEVNQAMSSSLSRKRSTGMARPQRSGWFTSQSLKRWMEGPSIGWSQ